MAGQLTIDTLKASSGVLATQNGMTGIAKAWVNFNGTGTVAINGSFNVSSITDNGTGDYTINFTTAMPNATYSVVGMCRYVVASGATSLQLHSSTDPTTSAVRIQTIVGGVGAVDDALVCVAILAS
jgi:hypothetical protein